MGAGLGERLWGSRMRVALVHDYLNQEGGAERVVEVLCSMFPRAPLYTSVFDARAMSEVWQTVDVRTSFMQKLSPRLKIAKALLPLYPPAFESFDLTGYDLVLSSCSTFSKGVLTAPGTTHVCYCHNTTRPLWMYHEYVAHENLGRGQRALLQPVMSALRLWDYAAAQRVDHFIANSSTTVARIRKFYRRDAEVIQPPIRVAEFVGGQDDDVQPYYLVMARLQSYKRLDLAIEACNRLQVPLRIAGVGPDEARLRRLAGQSVQFLGRVSNPERINLYRHCRALIIPGVEDFGLNALEAQAAGRPVIAFADGGSLETVLPGLTGILYTEQSADALAEVLRGFDYSCYDPDACRAQAARFDESVFKERMTAFLASVGVPPRANEE